EHPAGRGDAEHDEQPDETHATVRLPRGTLLAEFRREAAGGADPRPGAQFASQRARSVVQDGNRMAELTVGTGAPRIGRLDMLKKFKQAFFVISLTVGLGLFIFFIRHFGGFGKALEAVGAVGWAGVVAFIALATGTLVFPGIGWWI